MMSIFQIRLKNCIQAIIEHENGIRAAGGNFFEKDILSLKSYMSLIDKMELGEDEVRKLENMTSDFLAEIGVSAHWQPKQTRILQ